MSVVAKAACTGGVSRCTQPRHDAQALLDLNGNGRDDPFPSGRGFSLCRKGVMSEGAIVHAPKGMTWSETAGPPQLVAARYSPAWL